METWDYAHCLPYFKRMEDCLAAEPDDPFRGHGGPLGLERGPATNPLFGAFFEATQQAGYPLTDDVNGYRQEGFAKFDRNIRRGRRLSAARAYLHPVMRRPNLKVVTRAFVTRILLDGKRAVGVEYRQAERTGSARSRGEVILAGGAINSPQLLQLSGIGNAAELEALGVPVVHDLPGVGEHLQDHLEVYIQHEQHAARLDAAGSRRLAQRPWIGFQWLFFRRGPGATNHFEGGGFVRSNDDVAYPNLMFHFLPLAIRYDGTGPKGGHGYQVHVGPMYSDARGSVKITSTDPTVHPALRFNYLSTDQDRREWVEAIRVARRILGQPALAEFDGGETSPGAEVETDEQILDWVARDAETALHPSCTARMGTDPQSVIDPLTMGVHGIDGLRVVDASSMPYITNGNIYAPVMMLRREGRRPHPRQHAAAPGDDRLLPPPPGGAGARLARLAQPPGEPRRGVHDELGDVSSVPAVGNRYDGPWTWTAATTCRRPRRPPLRQSSAPPRIPRGPRHSRPAAPAATDRGAPRSRSGSGR